MVSVVEGIGALIGLWGIVLFPTAFIAALLAAFNIFDFRDGLYEHVGHVPGFRSETRWKAVVSSFGYLMLASIILVTIGGLLVPPAEETGSPTQTASPTPTATTSPTMTATPSPTASPTPTPTPTASPTPSPTPPTRPQTPPPDEVPEYTVVTVEDVSYAGVIRAKTHVRTSRPVSELSKEELRLIAQDIVAKGTSEVDVNAITIFFWEDDATIGAETAYARVDWAPYGEWERAGDVETGNYEHHEFTVKIF